jgi:uncharacterized protein (DUF924 family)
VSRTGSQEQEGPEHDAVLRFWFPEGSGHTTDPGQLEWWFRGGTDALVLRRFPPLLARARRGELDAWSRAPRSRLALILVLDQFPRTIHRGSAEAFSSDPQAQALALEGLDNGHYAALETPWEKTFFFLPLGHSEDLAHQQRAVALAEALARDAAPAERAILEHSASQARGHRDVIARFGRHPHRNAALGRVSTREEQAYLATGQLVHTRPFRG